MKGKLPGPGAAFAVFTAALLLNIVVSGILFWMSEDLGVLLAEPLAILLPTLLLARALDLDVRRTLRLHMPTRIDILLAVPLALSLAVVNDQISNLTSQVFPLDEDLQQGMIRLLRAETVRDWAIRILGIGIGAAVSEEILFRGFIQRGLEQGFRRSPAIFVASLLFAFIHLIPQGIPTYAAAGVVLGVTAVASGSIVVPALVHFIYNMSAVALLSLGDIETLGRPVWIPPDILVPALLMFGLTLGYFIRKAAAVPETAPPARPLPSVFLAEDLAPPVARRASIPEKQRRRGWLAVGCAVAWGTAVILGLFSLSLYQASSRPVNAFLIEELRHEILRSLPEEAPDRVEEVDEAFRALLAANEGGGVGLGQIFGLWWVSAQVSADRVLTDRELETILDKIRSLVQASAPVRRL